MSSGYYPEEANAYFEELLLSEYVWITRPIVEQPNIEQTIPVVVKTSSMTYKTSLNDRLIEYTIDFEDAFDYINNVKRFLYPLPRLIISCLSITITLIFKAVLMLE